MPPDLHRFVEAQTGVYDTALAEITAGRKQTHWMWFIFPQVAGLGSSAMAQRYAIQSRDEAVAYLYHPILGKRLREITQALLIGSDRSAEEIMGHTDALKLKSSMTLFTSVAEPAAPFAAIIERYFAGEKDPETLRHLSAHTD